MRSAEALQARQGHVPGGPGWSSSEVLRTTQSVLPSVETRGAQFAWSPTDSRALKFTKKLACRNSKEVRKS